MNTNTPTNEILSWQAPRTVNHERGANWYVAGGVAVIGATVYAVLSGTWSLAIVCVLCGAMYFLVRDHKFPDLPCTMTDKGVQIGDVFLSWTAIKGFWFITTPTYSELHFVPKTPRTPELVIQTGPMQLMEIRSFLADKTEELHHKQERLLDILARLIKL